MKTGIIVDFIFQDFINISTYVLKNIVNKMQEKQLRRSSFFKKL